MLEYWNHCIAVSPFRSINICTLYPLDELPSLSLIMTMLFVILFGINSILSNTSTGTPSFYSHEIYFLSFHFQSTCILKVEVSLLSNQPPYFLIEEISLFTCRVVSGIYVLTIAILLFSSCFIVAFSLLSVLLSFFLCDLVIFSSHMLGFFSLHLLWIYYRFCFVVTMTFT